MVVQKIVNQWLNYGYRTQQNWLRFLGLKTRAAEIFQIISHCNQKTISLLSYPYTRRFSLSAGLLGFDLTFHLFVLHNCSWRFHETYYSIKHIS